VAYPKLSNGVREAATRRAAVMFAGEVEAIVPSDLRYSRGRCSWLTPAEALAIMLYACRKGPNVVRVAAAFGRDRATVRRVLRSPRYHATERRFFDYAMRAVLPLVRRRRRR
jgi:hypothetical protein